MKSRSLKYSAKIGNLDANGSVNWGSTLRYIQSAQTHREVNIRSILLYMVCRDMSLNARVPQHLVPNAVIRLVPITYVITTIMSVHLVRFHVNTVVLY